MIDRLKNMIRGMSGVSTSPPPQMNDFVPIAPSGTKRCGNCRHWGEPGEIAEIRHCLYPLPKHVRAWAYRGDNSLPCDTWEKRL